MIEYAQRALTAAGYPMPGEKLGEGAYAKVYALDDKRVVKVTCDCTDAAVAELARKAQLRGGARNLVQIERVMRIPVDNRWFDAYVIVAERLQPLPYALEISVPIRCRSIGRGNGFLDKVRLRAAGEPNNPPGVNARGDIITVWDCAAANLKGIADDLKSIGVTYFYDYHWKNVMLRPGDRVVLSDFGGDTETSEQPEIEVVP